MKEQQKYLIVGAGLAGLCIAIHLLQEGHRVTLLDSGENQSSLVAAGQINPLVFRRMTKSWRVDDFLPYAESFYSFLEKEQSIALFFPICIRRLFSSAHERVLWLQKQHQDGFSPYMEPLSKDDDDYALAQNDFGSGRIKRSAFVHASSFLTAGKQWVAERGTLLKEKMDYGQLDPSAARYQNNEYDRILFCEGAHNSGNPWFGNLPVEHTKGEVLTLHSKEIPSHESLNRKCFLLPLEKETFRLGATYDWNTPNTEITAEAKKELLEKLKLLTRKPYSVIDQLAGIRPTTPDRRPIIGPHFDHKKIWIFNGLGTKGYLLAPLLAKELVDCLEGKKALAQEVRVERFY